MIRRQPIPQRRRHQKRLLTTTLDEVLRHDPNPTGPPGRNPLRDSHRAKRDGPVHWLDARAATGAGPARSLMRNAAPGPVGHERCHERYR
jgi:hypothetical protein